MSPFDGALAAFPNRGEILTALREVTGDRAAAVTIYRHYERALAACGEEPDGEIVALYRDIVWNERAPASDDGDLPRFATLFVGRRRELARLEALLVPRARLLVTGPAGVGKSRLAVGAAHAARGRFADGVRYVDLEGSADLEAVVRVLAREDDLEALVVLDGADEAVDALARELPAILGAHPRSAALVTSRRRCALPGAGEPFVVEHLPLPLANAPLGVVERTSSVALFLERALPAQPGLRLTAATAPAVVRLCRALDGLPLALELAAAQLRFYSLPALIDRLCGDGDAGNLLDRALRTSLASLEREERRALRRLAAFPFAWTMTEAEACIADADLPRDAVLPAVEGLLARSLLQSETRHGVVRFHLLETTRRAAAQDGDPAELAAVRGRAVAWTLGWMTAGGRDGAPDAETTRALDERADLVAAVLDRWATADDAVLDAIVATRKYWEWRGRAAESVARLRARSAAAPLEPRLAFETARALSTHLLQLGDNDGAAAAIETSLAIARRSGCPRRIADAGSNAGILAYNRGDVAAAEGAFFEAVDRYRALGAEGDAARVLLNLATIALSAWDWEAAEARLAAIGDVRLPPNERVLVAKNRAYAAAMRGEHALARVLADEAQRRCEDPAVSDEWKVETATVRGIVALRAGEPREALARFREALLLAPQLPFRVVAYPLEQAALAAEAIGAFAPASRLLAGVAALRARAGLPRSPSFETLFAAAAERAARALGARAEEEAAIGRVLDVQHAAEIVLALASAATEGAEETPSALDALSERERDVALLVGDGCTNRQIAERLCLSVKTVENHVTSILSKLRVARRAQIAALVARREPVRRPT